MLNEKNGIQIQNDEISKEKNIEIAESDDQNQNEKDKPKQEEAKPKKKIVKRAPLEKTIDECMIYSDKLTQDVIIYIIYNCFYYLDS